MMSKLTLSRLQLLVSPRSRVAPPGSAVATETNVGRGDLAARSDLFVLGCGRSGTSLAAGLFRDAGFFMGHKLHAPRPSNQKGFFEDEEINHLNDAMVARLLPDRSALAVPGYGYDVPDNRQHWLSRVPLSTRAAATGDEIERIRILTSNKPFCFKDPRFSYTLDVWRCFANRPKFICVFREPATFVSSVFAECLSQPYLHNLAISVEQLLDIWVTMYRHILDRHARAGDWIFVEYDDLVVGRGLRRLEAFTGVAVDSGFADGALNHSRPIIKVPRAVSEVLEELRARKGD